MNIEQIERVQAYAGDPMEELWKPRPPRDYVDLYDFWELRAAFRAYGLEHLRPSSAGHALAKTFLDAHERPASYSYTAYCRVAAAHQCLQDLTGHISAGGMESMFAVHNAFEAFHFFFGAALDTAAGVGNVVLGYGRKEDSYTEFVKSLSRDASMTQRFPDAVAVLESAREVKENYRDHISHRGRLACLLGDWGGQSCPHFERDFAKQGSAARAKSWRKQLREMAEGRVAIASAPEICRAHLEQLEKAADVVFEMCLSSVEHYLCTNGAQITCRPNDFCVDISTPPPDAAYLLYRCSLERAPYLNMWYHRLGCGPLPEKCINSACHSSDIDPMYFVSE